VTDHARRGAARLAGVESPSVQDTETTIEELKARLAKTIAYLKTLDPNAINASADRDIKFPLGAGASGQMKGADYLNYFVLPNYYFHLTTAYAILRHCGLRSASAILSAQFRCIGCSRGSSLSALNPQLAVDRRVLCAPQKAVHLFSR
jgi:hypothetical protein